MTFKNKFFLVMLAMILLACPLFAEDASKVTDVVNAYIFNPQQNTLQPVYVGGTIPANGILYLAGQTSRLSFSKDGQTIKLEKPGFYNASGSPAEISNETRTLIQNLVKSSGKSEAEKLLKGADNNLALSIDDPQSQATVSPST